MGNFYSEFDFSLLFHIFQLELDVCTSLQLMSMVWTVNAPHHSHSQSHYLSYTFFDSFNQEKKTPTNLTETAKRKGNS